MNLTTVLLLVLIGLFAGLISGEMGVGGGIIIVPGFVNVKFMLVLVATFVLGSYLGSKLAIDLPEKLLKQIFGFLCS